MFKSTDGGANWAPASTGLTNPIVQALVIDSAMPATLYAGTNGGVFKSTDGGANWALASTGLTNLFVQALAIDPVTSATLYAGTYGGVYKSTDSGASWAPASTGLSNPFVQALAIDPATPTTLYAGTLIGGIFKSPDGGASWVPMNTGLGTTKVFALAFDSGAPATLYAGTDIGLFRYVTSPAAPSVMKGVVVNSKTVRLNWQENAHNESEVRVYRKVNKGAFALYKTLPANATSFVDRRVKGNRTYSYQVTAANAAGESAPSNTSRVSVLLPPKPLKVRMVGGKVKLSWKNIRLERGYVIQRRAGKGGFKRLRRVRANSRSYIDRRAKKGVLYQYRVQAVGVRSKSSWSNRAGIRP